MPKAESSRSAQRPHASSFNPFSLGVQEDPESTPERYARDLKVLARMKEREARLQPISKSTVRRQKRREKSALTADLGEVGEALDAMEEDQEQFGPEGAAPDSNEEQSFGQAQNKQKKSGGKITQAQRKRELEQAKTRLPLLLKHEQYKANPFAAIRQHAQNTMQ